MTPEERRGKSHVANAALQTGDRSPVLGDARRVLVEAARVLRAMGEERRASSVEVVIARLEERRPARAVRKART